MSTRWLTEAPDSLMATLSKGRKHRFMVLWNLIWLPWAFGDLMFGDKVPAIWWPVTIAGVLVFLVLYGCALLRPRRELLRYALGTAALALLIMPINRSASGTFVIFSCVYLSLQPSFRQMLLRIAPVLLVWTLETVLLHWPWQVDVWLLVICVGASSGQCSMWLTYLKNADLRLSQEEVRRLAATAERERIGRDLHDLLGHTLSLVALKSELAGRLIERDPAGARREIADVERVARDALAQVRSAVTGIRAAALVAELASARLLLEMASVQFVYRRDDVALPLEIENTLALVLREAVTNIQRHARASNAWAEICMQGDSVRLCIRDDGRGGIGAHGNGLCGMRERIEAAGGSLSIASVRGQGTQLEIVMPLPAEMRATTKSIPDEISFDAPAGRVLKHA